MICPKCGKTLAKKIETFEDDGGLFIEFKCKHCSSKFHSFINPLELEEIFDDIEINE